MEDEYFQMLMNNDVEGMLDQQRLTNSELRSIMQASYMVLRANYHGGAGNTVKQAAYRIFQKLFKHFLSN